MNAGFMYEQMFKGLHFFIWVVKAELSKYRYLSTTTSIELIHNRTISIELHNQTLKLICWSKFKKKLLQ